MGENKRPSALNYAIKCYNQTCEKTDRSSYPEHAGIDCQLEHISDYLGSIAISLGIIADTLANNKQ